jgi:hypothetical protein
MAKKVLAKNNVTKKSRMILVSIGALLALVCSVYLFFPSIFLSEEQRCVADGGNWEEGTQIKGYFCIIPKKDAGKACSDAGQCLADQCIASQAAKELCKGKENCPAVGSCPAKFQAGRVDVVNNGILSSEMTIY